MVIVDIICHDLNVTSKKFSKFCQPEVEIGEVNRCIEKEAKKCSCFFNAFCSLFILSLSLSLPLSTTPKTTTPKTLSMDR